MRPLYPNWDLKKERGMIVARVTRHVWIVFEELSFTPWPVIVFLLAESSAEASKASAEASTSRATTATAATAVEAESCQNWRTNQYAAVA
jgi:hypothetical protein